MDEKTSDFFYQVEKMNLQSKMDTLTELKR